MLRQSISRRAFIGSSAAAGFMSIPGVLRAQPASIKVGLIHPVTGFVAYNGSQCRLGGLTAIDDINKAGGIKSMGGAQLEAVLGDSQSKVEVGVSEVERLNEIGVAAYVGCFQSPVAIAATQAAAKYNTPFLIDAGVSDLIVNRGLTNVFRLKPGFGVCVDSGISILNHLNKAAQGVAKSAIIVHESGEYGTGTAKLLSDKLPDIGISVKDVISHDNPTRNFDNIALRIRSEQPDIVMMTNYQNEYILLARTLYQRKVDLVGMYSFLSGGLNYTFVKDMPDVAQYMMDVNHWYNPKSEAALLLKKRIEGMGFLFTYEVYVGYSAIMLLADSLERAATSEKEPLIAALASSTYKAELLPYGPTKFVNGQNQGGRPVAVQALDGDILVVAPDEYASATPVFPRPKF